MRKDVLYSLHDDVTAGHLGFDLGKGEKVLLAKDSSKLIHVGQKSSNQRPAGLMQPVSPTEKPSTDLMMEINIL